MLEVVVLDSNRRHSDDCIAYNYIPMHLIQTGYRFIPLYNIRNDSLTEITGATLFVKVEKRTLKPGDKIHRNGVNKVWLVNRVNAAY